jgi:hypothetical protein
VNPTIQTKILMGEIQRYIAKDKMAEFHNKLLDFGVKIDD